MTDTDQDTVTVKFCHSALCRGVERKYSADGQVDQLIGLQQAYMHIEMEGDLKELGKISRYLKSVIKETNPISKLLEDCWEDRKVILKSDYANKKAGSLGLVIDEIYGCFRVFFGSEKEIDDLERCQPTYKMTLINENVLCIPRELLNVIAGVS